METAAAQMQRAKRRYTAFLRERANLALSGKSDPLTEDEIGKLEKEYPELVRVVSEGGESAINCKSSPPLPAKDSCGEARAITHNAAPNSIPSFSAPAVQLSSKARLRKSAPPLLLMQTRPLPNSLPRSLSADALQRHSRSVHASPANENNYSMMMFALQLFNERHQKSMMTRLSVVATALLSVAAALAHCTVVDPASTPGSLLSPSLLTLLVHANVLCGVYVRGRRRFTAPMLIVYAVLDIIPSLGLGIVFYNLGLIALESYGFRRASSAC
ncbi:hypothetical protein ABB37_09617 [Leptomonas pyrrhocoris]|uniref:Uncharacterized protein n=1 Tax=Leptomonas pyrrhocoris TaxID=157538 RepID=A0A0N0DQU4_LEPPY|nr:hypothetical protein ABB37_09617 [Leptomonas pyrrhocoris]KPA73688.1 hypothetical protein ABB37_09617 [Leptomonas pyrrhocoris]|eukprot:XP_015652127.1 hypothetical protein ABB37_09617 [Leptomonas pyrrhocoris]